MGKKFFYGWVIVWLAFLILVLYEIGYVFGIFLDPLVKQFGWSREELSWTISISFGLIPLGDMLGEIPR